MMLRRILRRVAWHHCRLHRMGLRCLRKPTHNIMCAARVARRCDRAGRGTLPELAGHKLERLGVELLWRPEFAAFCRRLALPSWRRWVLRSRRSLLDHSLALSVKELLISCL